jgi:hypothetical protein
MKKISSIIFAIVFLLSCNDDPVNPPDDQSMFDSSYFPLHVGNEWVYEVDFYYGLDTVHHKIFGKENIDGVIYYSLKREFSSRSILRENIIDTVFVRPFNENQINYLYEGKDTLFIDFQNNFKRVNQNYLVHNQDSISVKGIKYYNLKVLILDVIEQIFSHYAKGIGMVYRIDHGYVHHLIYAKINGKEIGNK